MFNEHVFKGTKLINSRLIFFHIDHLLGHFFSVCFDNHQIIILLILICLGIEAFKSWVTLLSCLHFKYTFSHHLGSIIWKRRRLWTDMSWFRFQLFCLTSDQWCDLTQSQFPHLWNGASASCELVVRIRDNQHQGPAQSLVHRSYSQELREAVCMCTNDGAE